MKFHVASSDKSRFTFLTNMNRCNRCSLAALFQTTKMRMSHAASGRGVACSTFVAPEHYLVHIMAPPSLLLHQNIIWCTLWRTNIICCTLFVEHYLVHIIICCTSFIWCTSLLVAHHYLLNIIWCTLWRTNIICCTIIIWCTLWRLHHYCCTRTLFGAHYGASITSHPTYFGVRGSAFFLKGAPGLHTVLDAVSLERKFCGLESHRPPESASSQRGPSSHPLWRRPAAGWG